MRVYEWTEDGMEDDERVFAPGNQKWVAVADVVDILGMAVAQIELEPHTCGHGDTRMFRTMSFEGARIVEDLYRDLEWRV